MTTAVVEQPFARGRVTKPAEVQVGLRVTKEMYMHLREQAIANGINVSEQIRRLISVDMGDVDNYSI